MIRRRATLAIGVLSALGVVCSATDSLSQFRPNIIVNTPCPFLSADDTKQTLHVTVHAAFCVDALEVSVKRYRRCVLAAACTALPLAPDDQLPVVNVTYAQAEAACAYEGKRLPTATEWDDAAQGSVSQQWPRRSDHWSISLGQLQSHFAIAPIHDVGRDDYDIAGSGAFDMAGNVSEIVSAQLGVGTWIVRGGSFIHPNARFTSASRVVNGAERDVGFRCVSRERR